MTTPRPSDALTYEQARDELISIVAKLEAGAATLDESIALWERGEALASRCQRLLEGARERVAEIQNQGAHGGTAETLGIEGENT